MKSIQPVLNAVFAAVLIIIMLIQFKIYKNSAPSSNESQKAIPIVTDTSFHGGINAFINTDTLNNNYLLLKDMLDELAEERIKYEGNINAQIKKLEDEVVDFQENAKYMTQTQGEQKQMELAEKEQNLMKMQQDLNNKLIESEASRNKIIQKKLADFLKEYNKDKGYHFIFGFNGSGNVLYADSMLDITKDVVEGLNKGYEEEKKITEKK